MLIQSTIDDCLPETEADQLKHDEGFLGKHYDAVISAISAADPKADDREAADQAASVYAREVLRADIQRTFPTAFLKA